MGDRLRLRLSIVTVLAVLAAMTGCAGPAPRPGAAPSRSRAAALLTVDGTALAQRRQLSGAQQSLIQHCMRRQGLPYLITGTGPEPAAGTTTADTIGTAVPPVYPLTGAPVASAQDGFVRALAPDARARYQAAYSGPDSQAAFLTLPSGAVVRYLTGGCEGQARAELYGSVRAAMEDTFVPQDVTVMFEHFVATDPPYRSALDTWQHCMATAGWPTMSPTAAINALQAQAATGVSPAVVHERRYAEAAADGHCDAISGLRRVRANERDLFLDRQPASTVAWLDRIAEVRQQALRKQVSSRN